MKSLEKYFELRGSLSQRDNIVLSVVGTVIILFIWQCMVWFLDIPKGILPSPWMVIKVFPEMHFEDALVRHTVYSLKLNIIGMSIATAVSLPLGFIIGLFPLFRGLSEKQIAVLRFLPITLIVGVLQAFFGIYDASKIAFLSLGIFVYLLPTVILRINQVEEVYIQTIKTLGANKLQIIKMVFIPATLSRVWDDIVNLAPISWTYIIIAEMLNNSGGVGALSYIAGRNSRADKTFAIMMVIFFIGIIWDKYMKKLGRKLFPYLLTARGGN